MFQRTCDIVQHLEKTKKPQCKAACNAMKDLIRRSRFMPRRDMPRRRVPSPQPSPQPSASIHPRPTHDTDEPESQGEFQGDFFGDDYAANDFPGLDGEADSDSENEDEPESNDAVAVEMEPVYERPREPVQVAEEHAEVSEANMDTPRPSRLCDLPAHRDGVYVQTFGHRAGATVENAATALRPYSSGNGFEHYESKINGIKENLYAPFGSQMDWEVARWAKMRGTGSTAFSDLLAIEGVAESLDLSYRNSDELNKIIDKEIPAHRPSFFRREVIIAGETFDIYQRPVQECIDALYGAPEHAPYLCFTPERHYADADMTQRLYHDMNTGKWWWSTQTQLEEDKPGATIIPVIISSDKTQLTLFRNKTAYPVYLTIGNLPKEIRRKPSKQGQVLLAYLPTTSLKHISNKAQRRRMVANLFHACMSSLLAPLKEAGTDGVIMASGDGVKRRCHPILASYIGDYPEQVLVTCSYYGDCPLCLEEKMGLGSYPCAAHSRSPELARQASDLVGTDEWSQACLDANIKPVQYPFWKDLPYTDIFRSITPDLLHQLYQGVMKHLIQWITKIVGADEIDARVRRLPANHSIRHFHKGITTLSRVSGTEHKQMCIFLLNLILDVPHLSASQSKKLITSTRALLDFLYLACYPIHSNNSLDLLESSLKDFHNHKEIFIELGAREHFSIPKLHSLCHYVQAIKLYGTCDNYNTETTERLHIDFAKDAYRASNRKDEYSQMTKWLERREKIIHHSNYLDWKQSQPARSESESTQSTSLSTPPVRYTIPGSQRTLLDLKCPLSTRMTRFPTVKTVGFAKLEDHIEKGGYGAARFEYTLKEFVARYRGLTNEGQIEDMAIFLSFSFRSVPVWHRIKFRNEELFGSETLDVVAAHPRRINPRGEVTQVSHFDAALIRTDWQNNTGIVSASERDFLQGLQIGRVRVIFSFPTSEKHQSRLFTPGTKPPSHLAYVEWFTKLSPRPDPATGLFRIKPLMRRDGSRAISVVPVEAIQQSVNLYPKWGGTVPPGWSRESILDTCPIFYLNPFKNTRMHFNMP
ncbi:hypothetical protein PM082_007008 [Marasmius tenuissimus]|nr:hypothetical protein PM082_007008 [Marasmius tenuissimus]